MRYQAVIFDLFGTLVDNFSRQEHERTLSDMGTALGVPGTDFARLWVGTFEQRATGQFASIPGNIEHILAALDRQANAEQIAAAADIRLDFTRRGLAPRSDAVATLSQLRAAGHKLGLISDCSLEVPILWADTPFVPLVEVPIFSCSVHLKKPDPRIYRLACERLRVSPGDCLYVGDGSSRELTGAWAVGMHPVLIRVPYEDSYDAHRIDAEEWHGPTVAALSEVLGLVQ